MEENLFEFLETFEEDVSNSSNSVQAFDFDFWKEEEMFQLFECFEGDLSYYSDAVHSFDFDFVLEDDISELLENFAEYLLHSSDAVAFARIGDQNSRFSILLRDASVSRVPVVMRLSRSSVWGMYFMVSVLFLIPSLILSVCAIMLRRFTNA